MQLESIINKLKNLIGAALHIDNEMSLDKDIPFQELGLDSIIAVELVKSINEFYTLKIEEIALFDYSTINELSQHVLEQLNDVGVDNATEIKEEIIEIQEETNDTEPVLDFSFEFEEEQPQQSVFENSVKENNEIEEKPNSVVQKATVQKTNKNTLETVKLKIGRIIKDILQLDPAELLDEEIPFQELGMDSIMAVELMKNINIEFELEVEEVVLFDYSTLSALAGYISEELGGEETIYEEYEVTETQPELKEKVKEPIQEAVEIEMPIFSEEKIKIQEEKNNNNESNDQRIAIVGMSGRYPKAKNLDQYWDNIAQGKDCIEEVPKERWDTSKYFEEGGDIYAKWLGRLDDVDKFDAEFFNISRTEAELIDPQSRILMEECWSGFEDAGYSKQSLNGKSCGVYVGIISNEYAHQLSEANLQENLALMMMGNLNSIFASRMSYFLNLKGPAIAIDTACSSSLVAIHLACQSLLNKETDMAVAGGVSLYLGIGAFEKMCAAGMLSPEGKCKTFDDGANGFVPGEGAGIVVLKRFEDAVRDGDNIKGVIIGSGVNQDGKTNGISAPSANSQKNLIKEVYSKNKINPESITYVEAHGTGTKLGDPIEVEALKSSFREFTDKKDYCGLGSVKSNIGHTTAAAGIASIHKVLKQFENRQIAPTINFNVENKLLKTKDSPFFINEKLRTWKVTEGVKRRASISSFGFSGTNAHIVLEEYNKVSHYDKQKAQIIIPLSAKKATALKIMAENLKQFLTENPTVSIQNLAYTYQVGRTNFDERLVFIVSNKEELIEQIEYYIKGEKIGWISGRKAANNENILLSGKAGKAYLKIAIQEKEMFSLGQLWCTGTDIDWRMMYEGDFPAKISVPTYPFERNRYWFKKQNIEPADRITKKNIHPLLHENISNLRKQCFLSQFDGKELIFENKKTKLFPSSAYIEMAFEAANVSVGHAVNQLNNLKWLNSASINHKSLELCVNVLPDENTVKFQIHSNGKSTKDLCEGEISLDKHFSNKKTQIGKLVASFHDNIDVKSTVLNIEKVFKTYVSETSLLVSIDGALGMAEGKYSRMYLFDIVLTGITQFENQNHLNIDLAPLSVAEISFSNSLMNTNWAHIIKIEANEKVATYEVNIYDNEGNSLGEIKRLSVKITENKFLQKENQKESQNDQVTDMTYAVKWERFSRESADSENAQHILLVSGNNMETEKLVQTFSDQLTTQGNSVTIDKEIENIPEPVSDIYLFHGLLPQQNKDALDIDIDVFKVFKKLNEIAWDRNLRITVFTQNTQQVFPNDKVNVSGSGIIGLVGTVIKESFRWKSRVIDLDNEILTTNFVDTLNGIPYSDSGDLICYRGKHFYNRSIYPLKSTRRAETKLKQNGVYVILGGAGGIGKVTSSYLIKNYNANIIWLGRRGLDKEIIHAQNEIEKLGQRPLYYQCDALNDTSMRAAYLQIKEKVDIINGLFHSAIVLDDKILSNMDEKSFKRAYLPKSLGSYNFVEAFKNEPLDFICFYSSVQALLSAPGQANYSAGCTFKDTYAHSLKQELKIPTYIINWGFWGNDGIVSNQKFIERMKKIGIESISAPEGMEVLETVLSNNRARTVAIKLTALGKKVSNSLVSDKEIVQMSNETVVEYNFSSKVYLQNNQDHTIDLEKLCFGGILQVLNEMGFENYLKQNNNLPEVRNKLGINHKYNKLFEAIINQLHAKKYISRQNDQIHFLEKAHTAIHNFDLDQAVDSIVKANPGYKAHCELFYRCVTNFKNVVKGKKSGVSVLFPNGSMDDIGDVYKGNKQSDFLNELISDSILEIVSNSKDKLKDGEKIRILEIGAGTGGTSKFIFEKLAPFAENIEYLYTDLSKSFLFYAEKKYKTVAPYLQTAIFNIEHSADEQGIDLSSYDIVIGTDVVHATKNIKNTLVNIKSTLKEGGIIFLSELATNDLFVTLIFGLLEGWWLAEDSEIRMMDSPCLEPKSWEQVFKECSFSKVVSHPIAQQIPRQLIVAKSDGTIIRPFEETEKNEHEEVTVTEKIETKRTQEKENFNIGQEEILDKAQNYLKEVLSNVLKLKPSEIDVNESLQSLGIESVMINELAKKFTNDFGKIPVTIFFEYETIAELSEYFITNHSDFFTKAEESITNSEKQELESSFSFESKHRFIAKETNGNDQEDIVVIGMGGVYPKSVNSSELWENVRGNTLLKPSNIGTNNEIQFGLVTDPEFSNLSEKFEIKSSEFDSLNRQQKLLLEVIHQAMDEGRVTLNELRKCKTGVFVGEQFETNINSDKQEEHERCLLPHVVSYLLDLKGPSESVNAFCTSTYVALHRATQSIKAGECDIAIVGAVNILSDEFIKEKEKQTKLFAQGNYNLFTKDGFTKSFSDDATGFVVSEGVGAIIIKPLHDAKNDGNKIIAKIKGSGVHHGGKSFSLHAPNIQGIKEAIRMSLEKSKINSATIDYIEAHGIANPIADAIELKALNDVYKKNSSNPEKKWHIGSVKPTIGHPLLASGIASIIKVLKAFEHKMIPGIAGLGNINTELEEGHSFVISNEPKFWENGTYKRRAALNSFAVGGINAHIILEEYSENDSSGHNKENLEEFKHEVENELSAKSTDESEEKEVSVNAKGGILTSFIKNESDRDKLSITIQDSLGCSVEDLDLKKSIFEFDSIQIMQVARSINDVFGIELKMGQVMGIENLEELFQLVSTVLDNKKSNNSNSSNLIKPIDYSDQRYKLSSGQKGIWFEQVSDSNMTTYNTSIAFSMKGRAAEKTLLKALELMFIESPILSANFFEENGELVLKLDQHKSVLTIDYGTVNSEEDALTYFKNKTKLLFDLALDRLVRFYAKYDPNDNKTYLLFIVHHIIFDGMSTVLFLESFLSKYQQIISSKKIELKNPDLAHVNFVDWEENYIKSEQGQISLNYWKNKIGADLPYLKLPVDFKIETGERSDTIGYEILLFEGKSLDDLKKLAHDYKVNLSILILSLFKVFLTKISNQNDVLILTPIMGRPLKEIEKSIGYYVNMMLVRNQINPLDTFADVVDQIKKEFLTGIDHASYPFPKLISELKLSDTDKNTSAFHISYVFQNMFGDTLLKSEEYGVDQSYPDLQDQARSDYSLEVFDLKKQLKLKFKYNLQLFKKETIQRHLGYFNILLDQILEKPQTIRVKDCSVLSVAEEEDLIVGKNNTRVNYSGGKTVIDSFEEQVRNTPDACALKMGNIELTYSELNKRANQVANCLKAKGIRKEDLVGICIDRCPDMLVGILGILKAEGTYVPIDTNYPKKRIDYIIHDANLNLVLCNDKSKRLIENVETIVLDDNNSTINKFGIEDLKNNIAPNGLAYVLYTSGSTGNPKGVMMEHASLFDYINTYQTYFNLTAEDRVLQLSSIGFDSSIKELFPILTTGGLLVITKDNKDMHQLLLDCVENNITVLGTNPYVIEYLNKHFEKYKLKLRFLSSGGDILKKEFIDNLYGLYPIYNTYGPTESTVCATYHKITELTSTIPIGRPISNRSVYILDENGYLLPEGVIGEIHIGGAGLARGYLNQQELTAEKFIKNPFIEGEKMYCSGDLGKWLPNGTIEFHGRKDNQVKIRGNRVELGEVESALQRIKEIEQCVVLAKQSKKGYKQLVAFIVSKKELNREDIRQRLNVHLPSYMIPDIWIELNEIPLTTNGKIDKQKLASITTIQPSLKEYISASTDIELKLVPIWQDLLEVNKIGKLDDFFQLGGHSLLVTQLIAKVRDQFNIEVTINDLFENKTIASLANLITTKKGKVVLPKIKRRSQTDKIQLSYEQERLWFVEKMNGSVNYHMPYVARLKGNVDPVKLEFAFQEIINRHEVLRTIIIENEGEPLGKLIPIDQWKLKKTELSHQINSNELIQNEILKPFDMTKEHMLRAHLIKEGENQYIFVFVLHHIAADGWSLPILIREFSEIYKTSTQENVIELPPLEIQYSDFAAWQKSDVNKERFNESLKFWKNKLIGVEPLHLPTDYPRPKIKGITGANLQFELDTHLSTALKTVSKQYSVTLFMLLLSGLKVLMYKYTGQKDICIGIPAANRTHTKLQMLIGFFINTLAIRTKLKETETFAALLNDVKVNTIAAYDNQMVPFEQIVDSVIQTRDLSIDPVFQVMFDLRRSNELDSIELNDIKLSKYEVEHTTAKFDLTFDAEESKNGIRFNVEYSTELFKEETILQMVKHYQKILKDICSDVHRPIGKIQLLTKQYQDELITELKSNSINYGKSETILTAFHKTVKTYADTIAVKKGDKQITYNELNEKSNQVARKLIELTNSAIAPIGLCMNQSIEMIIGILGILKTGNSYVPIDINFPQNRIDYILKDTGVKILICDRSTELLVQDQKTLVLDELWIESAIYNTDDLTIEITGKQLAYIIYTSGSTGKPKGVMIEHASLLDYAKTFQSYFNLTPADKILQQASIAFDTSVEEIYPILITGGTLVITNDAKNIPLLLNECIENEVTILSTNPYVLEYLNEHYQNNSFGFRALISGGDVLKREFINNIYQTYHIFNTYGPTESTVCATYFHIKKLTSIIPIGEAISNRTVLLLDENQNIVPLGVAGEICISGAGLARGYLNLPELTAEKFVNNPFIEGERMFCSGDLGKWLPNGTIEFLGRKDDQVKIRGNRVELAEIEIEIYKIDAIEKCCVLAKEDNNGYKVLVAYVVCQNELNKQLVTEELKQQLPLFMVPNLWVQLDDLPVNTNGKIDKKALLNNFKVDVSTQKYIAPSTEVEIELVKIWKSVLGAEIIGINDDFFEIGGHSLLAMRLIAQIKKEFKIEIPIRKLFENTTPYLLAQVILREEQGTNLPKITKKSLVQNIPLSFEQERLWFIDQLNGTVQYHMPMVLRFKGQLNFEFLNSTFKEIVNRHEILRTTIHEKNGERFAQVTPKNQWEAQHTIWERDQSEVDIFINEIVSKPFNLSTDNMLRVHVIERNSKDFILSVVMHHIASDGWSIPILVNEFVELFEARSRGVKSKLKPLQLQYSDYAIWQKTQLKGDKFENMLSYWEAKLANTVPLQLPTDFQRPLTLNIEGRNRNFDLEKEFSDKLNSFCKAEGVTLFMMLLSVFKVLLYRYSGQNDICVGTPVANRTQNELQGLIGFFVNTLPIRTELSEELTFKELLTIVKENTIEAYDHQLVPLNQIIESVVKSRVENQNPLFQVMFVLENTLQNQTVSLENANITPYEIDLETSKFDLTFNIKESKHGISIGIQYASSLFKEETIDRMGGHFIKLIKSVLDNYDDPIGGLPMITQYEEEALHNNSSLQGEKVDNSIAGMFYEQVKLNPNAIAVDSFDGEYTYETINKKSNQLANHLLEQGIKSESLVPICMERSVNMIIGILGIIKAGAAYVPINPNDPIERIQFIVEDTNASIILAESAFSMCFEKNSVEKKLIFLDLITDTLAKKPDEKPNIKIAEEQLLNIMYTSGTTGMPKGVMVKHSNVFNLIKKQSVIAVFKTDIVLQWSNYVFDGSTYEIFGSLLSGAKLVVISKEIASNALALASLINEKEITICFLTPALFNLVVDSDVESLRNLRKLLIGGDVMSPTHSAKAFEYLSNGEIINLYGPTETVVFASFYEIKEAPINIIPIGKPIDNVQLFVLDTNKKPVPFGVIGELYIGGEGVAKGYLNRPELTAEKFIISPFSQTEKLYRTGDLVRKLSDGNLVFIGRKDNQVKIRGYRIELGEIESKIRQLNFVKDAIVLVHDQGEVKELVAYLVSEEKVDTNLVIKSLKDKLPQYMVPKKYAVLAHLPLTSNGKVDKRKLRNQSEIEVFKKAYVAPTNPIETKLVNIWGKLLGVETLGIDDDFFAIGGHSLMATNLIGQVRKEFSIETSIRELFENSTIKEFARIISSKEAGIRLPVIVKNNLKKNIPLSFSQERLFFIDQLQGSVNYHIPVVFNFQGKLDKELITTAFNEIINRHEIVRTTIHQKNGELYAELLPKDQWQLTHSIGTGENIDELIKLEMIKPFDLASDHMLRVHLIEKSKMEHVFIIIMHHIASDGASIPVLINELEELYLSKKEGKQSQLKDLFIQYSDLAIWQKTHLKGDFLNSMLDYWQNKLQDSPHLSLPYDFSKTRQKDWNGGNCSFELDVAKTKQIKAICTQQGTTLFMFLLGAIKILLYRYSGQTDICIGTPIANRTQSELEGLIGFFVNTLVIRTDIKQEQSFKELLAKIKENTISAYDNQLAPFEKVVERVVKTRDLSINPLFQVLFVIQNIPDIESVKIFDGKIVPHKVDTAAVKFDLTFNVKETNESISFGIDYAKALFKQETIDEMATHLQQLIDAIINNINNPINQLKMLKNEDLMHITKDFNNTNIAFPVNETIISCFQKQVNENPEAIAIVFENKTLTYAGLNEQSNQLAHYLMECGVEKEELIPICIERSVEMMVGILGILKAGAAYVPIDPNFPKERIQFFVKDTSAKIIVTMAEFESKFESLEMKEYLVLLDTFSEKIKQFSKENLNILIAEDQLVNVIYTSGSTGIPKGVLTENKGLLNRLFGMNIQFNITKNSVFLQKTTFTFDVSVWELFLPLINGAKLVLAKPEGHKDPTYLLELIEVHKVNIVHFVPSMLAVFLEQKIEEKNLFLTDVLSGGEVLTNDLLQKFTNKNSQIKIHNNYGPAEAAIDVTSIDLTNYSNEQQVIPIGKTLANTSIYIVNNDFKINPIGVVGEIIVEGIQVARGYLNRSDLTKEKFAKSPFNTEQRIYKTGDLGKWLPDGTIAFIGRKDNQIKIRGYRIELGEIENAIIQIEQVTQTAVLVNENSKGTKQLTAYIKTNQPIESAVVREQLNEKLPEYMIPQIYIQLNNFPLLSNGKIDRNKLPKPEESAFNRGEYLAPEGPIEVELTKIWQDLLNIDKIGVLDNFFELGGESILAIKLMSRINKMENVKISLADIFIQKNIKKLGQLILKNKNETNEIIRLNEVLDAENLFMIHPGKAGCEVYLPLAKSIAPHYTCYGIDSYNLYNTNNRISNLQKLAAHYLEQIEYIQQKTGQKKYTLFGWSLGGQIALEIASILEEKGIQDVNVILIDTLLNDGDHKVTKWRSELITNENVLNAVKDTIKTKISQEELDNMIDYLKTESELINQNVSRKLKFTHIIFFKAMLQSNDEMEKEMQEHIRNLNSNNIRNVIENDAQLKVYKVKNAHHYNILEKEELIVDKLISELTH